MSIQLHLETVGACDARCKFCVYDSEQNRKLPKKPMSMPLYEKIIDEAATIPQITEVAFAGLAEPLMDPLLVERIAYVRRVAPEKRTELYTNGFRLSPARFDALRDAGLHIVVISLNAVNAAQHAKQMGVKGKFETTCAHADYAIANKGNVHVEVRAVVNSDDFSIDDMGRFVKRWGAVQFGGHGKLISERNWAGGNRTVVEFDPNSTCIRALQQIAVHRDGRVLLCCYDPLAQYPFGDLTTQSIREVYNSDPYIQFREWHRDNQAAKHPLCAVCTRV